MRSSTQCRPDRIRISGAIISILILIGLSTPIAAAPPQVTGLWYDPASSGQGLNLQVSSAGLFGYYYGYDNGKPLWLVFDIHPDTVQFGEEMALQAFMPNDGFFGDPVSPNDGGIVPWGELTLRFDSCTRAFARLDGLSGTQELDLELLAGIDGLDPNDCIAQAQARPLADATGAWYAPDSSGQGWNFVQTPAGLAGFFYGYDETGDPLWLIIEQILEITPHVPQRLELLSGLGGSFTQPTSPQDLQHWGMVEITLNDCRSAVARISGQDGHQVQSLQMLTNVPGLAPCEESIRPLRFNDTGIEFCGNASSGNQQPCTGNHPPDQDAEHGRDLLAAHGLLVKAGSGSAGFDYTKISGHGQPLPPNATAGTTLNDWNCTRDNVTGLIWEVKVQDATHLRHQRHGYSWYDPDSPDNHPGVIGQTTSCANTLAGQPCNTFNFVNAVNESGLCGLNQWRMPTRVELESIMHYGSTFPAIDSQFFANTPPQEYWTSHPRADSPNDAWALSFGIGGVDYFNRSAANLVRLVHEGL